MWKHVTANRVARVEIIVIILAKETGTTYGKLSKNPKRQKKGYLPHAQGSNESLWWG